jgi:2-hydroxy-6-oxonona-2,4-dienedioate hydrolase
LNPTLETCRKRSQGTVYDPASAPETMVLMRLTSYSQPWMVASWRSQVTAMMDMDKTRPYRILERLERLDVETMVVWGREDPRGVYASAVKGVARMPKAKLVTFEKCGHLPFLEQPERYNRDLRAFLTGGLAALAA